MDADQLILQEFLSDSSDDDEIELCQARLPPMELLINATEDEFLEDTHRIIDTVISRVQRERQVKLVKYFDTIEQYTDDEFVKHFRLSRKVTYKLIKEYERSSLYKNIIRHGGGRKVLSAEHHVFTFLWFAGHEAAGYRDVADQFGMTISALFIVITRVSDFLLSLANNVIRWPTDEEKKITDAHYQRHLRFPNVIGIIGGTQIRIDRPSQDSELYANRDKYFSIQMQGIVNHNQQFLDIFLGYPGSLTNAEIFTKCDIFDDIPNLCGANKYIVANSDYELSPYVMTPYKDCEKLTAAQIHFNETLENCRMVVDETFAALKQRFRQLYHLKLKNRLRAVKFIHACCVLHNLADQEDLNLFETAPQQRSDPEAVRLSQIVIMEETEPVEQPDDAAVIRRDEVCRQLALASSNIGRSAHM